MYSDITSKTVSTLGGDYAGFPKNIIENFWVCWEKKTSTQDTASVYGWILRATFLYTAQISFMVSDVWIGLNDLDEYGIYRWVANNESLGAWSNWHNGQPSHYWGEIERCVVLLQSYWNDRPCDGSHAYEYLPLCEQSPWKYQHKFIRSLFSPATLECNKVKLFVLPY